MARGRDGGRRRRERGGRAASASSGDESPCGQDLRAFDAQLSRAGLAVRDVQSDGSCLFRAVSDQLHGDEGAHEELRARCVAYMRRHADDFAPFVDDSRSFDEYLEEMARVGVWGGNLELQALSMALALDIRIHQVGAPSYDIRNAFQAGRARTPVHLSYHLGQHYASVRRRDEEEGDGPAGHAPLSKAREGSQDERDESSDEDDSARAEVREVSARAEEVEGRLRATLQMLSAQGDGGRGGGAARAAVEDEAGVVRGVLSDAVARARRNAAAGGEEYDKRLARSRRRVYGMLDAAAVRVGELEVRIEALNGPEIPVVAAQARRPSKKKAQAAKRNERKARRMREQERAAVANVVADVRVEAPCADGVEI